MFPIAKNLARAGILSTSFALIAISSAPARAISDTPMGSEPWPYATRAVAYIHLGKYQQALDDLNNAISNARKGYRYLSDFYRYRCFVQLNRGKTQEALDDCNAALKLRADDPSTLDFRGDVEYRIGDYTAAIADFDNAMRSDPDNAGALYVRGLAREKTGDAAGGKADVADALSKNPQIAKDYPAF